MSYESRVRKYESEGMTRSDAQAVVDAEDITECRPNLAEWCANGSNREVCDIAEIKAAVDAGADVRAGNDNYRVIRDSIGQYLIEFTPEPNWIGLHGRKGTKYEHQLNMSPVYIKQKAITIQWGEQRGEGRRRRTEATYYFDTSAEITAFRRGIREAMGSMHRAEYEITYTDEE